MEKMNQKLVTELNRAKSWIKFLDNNSNFNKSFQKGEPNILREGMFDETGSGDEANDGSPEQSSDKLILGDDEGRKEAVNDGNFIVISTDINGGIHIDLVEGEDENDALEQTENEMLTQTMVIAEESLMELISKLSQYLPEEINTEDVPDKPPFIDEPEEKVIDEDNVNN